MLNKIKEYREYRKNIKTTKKAIAKLGSTALPLIATTSENALKFVQFATHVMNECKGLDGEELADKLQDIIMDAVKVLADKFETDETRLFEIAQYIATLNKEDIQKIISHAQVETLHIED